MFEFVVIFVDDESGLTIVYVNGAVPPCISILICPSVLLQNEFVALISILLNVPGVANVVPKSTLHNAASVTATLNTPALNPVNKYCVAYVTST